MKPFFPAYRHCRHNLQTRYGLHLSLRDYLELCAYLASLTKREVLDYSHSKREVLLLWLAERSVVAIFEPSSGLLITFLPPHSYHLTPHDRHAQQRDRKRRYRTRRKNRREQRAAMNPERWL